MEEKKRLTATKKAIEAFRETNKDLTDSVLSKLTEETYPNIYYDNVEVATEIVKELYRRQEELTEQNFTALLQELTEGRKLVRFGKAEREESLIYYNVEELLSKIYREAQQKTTYLSQYSEYNAVKEYLDTRCKEKGKTLAQILFYELNNKALKEKGMMSGIVLPFHCYSEPNGDIVFTKSKRSANDYNSEGKPKGSGCMGVLLLCAVVIALCCFI